MDYSKMVDFHKQHEADATIAVLEVPWEEAPRFGIMSANPDGTIYEFAEKPKEPKSTLASMGIYVFSSHGPSSASTLLTTKTTRAQPRISVRT